jgi:glutathione synthase
VDLSTSKKILVIADPIELLKAASDTSLFLMREAVKAGHSVLWADSRSVAWVGQRVLVRARPILDAGSRQELPRQGPESETSLQEFSHVFIRKEPPFDESYQKLCWILRPYENRIHFFNSPTALLLEHEKMIPLSALAEGVIQKQEMIESCVTDDLRVALDFARKLKSEHLISKPWLGHGGRDIQMLDRESFIQNPHDFWKEDESVMLQPFHEAIFERGDRRVLVMNAKVIGDFVRLPKKGHFVSNLVRGGQAFLRDMEPEEISICERLCPWMLKRGILFAGLDFIDNRLSEVNITCPTGLSVLEDLLGDSQAKMIFDQFMNESALPDWLETGAS